MNDLSGSSFGRYHLVEKLGEGGMAVVYKAFDTRLECDVAVKVIRMDNLPRSSEEVALKRFEREAKAVAQLTHPNIVKVMDFGEENGLPYLVMPFLPGGTLKQYLGKPMPYAEAAHLLAPVADALAYAHLHNVVHRDVKPSNILITELGQPMLTDFGIAKIMDLQDGQTLTGTGVGIGTPEYMAPEQWTGKITPSVDIYSLGVVFYELVTGQKPYTADTPAAILLKQASDPLPKPSSLVSGLPEKVEQVIYKALAKNPVNRYQNMIEFANDLSDLREGKNWKAKEKPPINSGHTESSTHATVDEKKESDQTTGATTFSDNSDGFGETKRPERKTSSKFVFESDEKKGLPENHGVNKLFVVFLLVLVLAGAIAVINAAKEKTEDQKRYAAQTAAIRKTSTQSSMLTQTAAINLTATASVLNNGMAILQSKGVLVFGPESGILAHQVDGIVSNAPGDQNLSDFITEATFINPYASSDNNWDYGFMFRHSGANQQYRLVISSTQKWELYLREDDDSTDISSGYLHNLNTQEGESNKITLIVSGGKGYFLLNDQFVAELDLSQKTDPGDVLISTGINNGDEVDGKETKYENWQIWSLEQITANEKTPTINPTGCTIDKSKIAFGTIALINPYPGSYSDIKYLYSIITYNGAWPVDNYQFEVINPGNGCYGFRTCFISKTDNSRLYCGSFQGNPGLDFPYTCHYQVIIESDMCGNLFEYDFSHTYSNYLY